jgi:hypothetical protein
MIIIANQIYSRTIITAFWVGIIIKIKIAIRIRKNKGRIRISVKGGIKIEIIKISRRTLNNKKLD